MYYKTHIVSSICLGAGVSILLNYPFHINYIIGLTFGSLLPDIDEPKSYIGRRSFGIAHLINVKLGHRGFTHSLLAWLILSYICVFFWSPLAVGISFGYLFHLIGDFFSTRSIPVLAPFSYERPKLPFTYKVGSGTEDILLIIFTLILLYLVFILGHLHETFFATAAELLSNLISLLIEMLKFTLSQ